MVAVSIDGKLTAPEAATVSIFDRGFLYGDGCFEVLRTWDGIARDLDAHLDRLLGTAAALELRTPDRAKLGEFVYRTIAAAGPGEHRIRIVLTRGTGTLAAGASTLGPGRTIVVVEPLPESIEEVSLALVDYPLPRRRGRGHKTLAYLDSIIARELARAANADEAVRLDADGFVAEGATCNVFAVIGGAVVTPPVDAGVLPGIVRARVLRSCSRLAIPTSERRMTVVELRSADELFVTSAIRGVVPVTRLDGALLTSGPVTQRIVNAYLSNVTG
ncbi:MAG TPA: aminotransferase class IV [Kofleriaceae bacterium]